VANGKIAKIVNILYLNVEQACVYYNVKVGCCL